MARRCSIQTVVSIGGFIFLIVLLTNGNLNLRGLSSINVPNNCSCKCNSTETNGAGSQTNLKADNAETRPRPVMMEPAAPPKIPVPPPCPMTDNSVFGDLKLITTGTNPSHKMFILNKSNDLLSKLYLHHGTFEGQLQNLLKRCLEKSNKNEVVFFDIGANIGIHALYIAALNYDVVAVEADVDTYSMLTQSINANHFYGKIQAFNVALTSERGNIEMLRNANNIGNNRIMTNQLRNSTAKSELRHTVRGIKLDDLLPFLPHKDVVLKIDIEGHECHVLNMEQAQSLFASKKITCISMEFTPKDMDTEEQCVAKMISLFTSFNFVPYYAHTKEWGKRINSTNMYQEVYGDLLWLPASANPAEYF